MTARPRALGLTIVVAAALCAIPSAQAWDLMFLSPEYQGPLEDYVTPILDGLCIPDAGVGTDPPFLMIDDNCLGNSPPSSPPPAPSEAPGNATGGP